MQRHRKIIVNETKVKIIKAKELSKERKKKKSNSKKKEDGSKRNNLLKEFEQEF